MVFSGFFRNHASYAGAQHFLTLRTLTRPEAVTKHGAFEKALHVLSNVV